MTQRKVRIDRTSQLLIAMSITIAEFVKQYYCRRKKDELIRQLSKFEEIVRETVIHKNAILTKLLDIEIFFFSRRKNDADTSQIIDIASLTKRNKDPMTEQFFQWIKNNHLFGEAIDKTKDYTDKRFDRKPRIKTNIETG